MQQMSPRTDPAPSRWSYRFQRLMLTPLFRRLLRLGLPMGVLFFGLTYVLSDETRRATMSAKLQDLRHQVETRPEFSVSLLAIEGASEEIETEIRETFPYDLPISSFDVDLQDLQTTLAQHPAIAAVSLHIRKGGVLLAEIKERTPIALWRNSDGLWVVDIEGVQIKKFEPTLSVLDLPVVVGEGAEQNLPEALQLFTSGAPLGDRMQGLVRIGDRRWDVVLDRDQRILLPRKNATQSLERVIVLNDTQDLFERDVALFDMRLTDRPTLRMNTSAQNAWWQLSELTPEVEE